MAQKDQLQVVLIEEVVEMIVVVAEEVEIVIVVVAEVEEEDSN
jgi:hypothetical protein